MTAEYADLLSGNTDVMRTIPTENLSQAFPTFQADFTKAEVRKAISMAIDRDQIIESIFRGSQTSARSFVSPVVAGARPDTCGEACQFDPVKAKAQYVATGGPPKLQISYNGDDGNKDWVDATCNQLKPTWVWSASPPPSRSSPTC